MISITAEQYRLSGPYNKSLARRAITSLAELLIEQYRREIGKTRQA
jgi:hypothetical protein